MDGSANTQPRHPAQHPLRSACLRNGQTDSAEILSLAIGQERVSCNADFCGSVCIGLVGIWVDFVVYVSFVYACFKSELG